MLKMSLIFKSSTKNILIAVINFSHVPLSFYHHKVLNHPICPPKQFEMRVFIQRLTFIF